MKEDNRNTWRAIFAAIFSQAAFEYIVKPAAPAVGAFFTLAILTVRKLIPTYDWINVIETAVLVTLSIFVPAYLVQSGRFRPRTVWREIGEFIEEGQLLRANAPTETDDELAVGRWLESVQQWTDRTYAFLDEKLGKLGSTRFVDLSLLSSGSYRGHHSGVQSALLILNRRLSNLIAITEQPNVFQ